MRLAFSCCNLPGRTAFFRNPVSQRGRPSLCASGAARFLLPGTIRLLLSTSLSSVKPMDRNSPSRVPQGRGPRLLDQVRAEIRQRHYSPRTEDACVSWITRYIRYHGVRHPREMGKLEVETFPSHLAMDRNVAASTQNRNRPPLPAPPPRNSHPKGRQTRRGPCQDRQASDLSHVSALFCDPPP